MAKNILVTGGLGAVGRTSFRSCADAGNKFSLRTFRIIMIPITRAATSASTARSSDCGRVAAGRPATPPKDAPSTSSTTSQPSSGAGTARTTTRRSGAPTRSAPRTSSGCRRRRASRPSTSAPPRSTATSTASWPKTSWTSIEVRQMNDYALSKWVNEQQMLNSATQFDTKSVRVRLFNTYGPGSPTARTARSSACSATARFTTSRSPSTAGTSAQHLHRRHGEDAGEHHRQFQPGRGVQHRRDRLPHHRGRRRDIILRLTGKRAEDLVTYKDGEILTTRQKLVDSVEGSARPGSPHHRDARGRNRPHAGLDAPAVRRLTMASPHILTVFGTRPEAVKMAPVLQALADLGCRQHGVLHGTARHPGPAGDAQLWHHARHRSAGDARGTVTCATHRSPVPGARHRA